MGEPLRAGDRVRRSSRFVHPGLTGFGTVLDLRADHDVVCWNCHREPGFRCVRCGSTGLDKFQSLYYRQTALVIPVLWDGESVARAERWEDLEIVSAIELLARLTPEGSGGPRGL